MVYGERWKKENEQRSQRRKKEDVRLKDVAVEVAEVEKGLEESSGVTRKDNPFLLLQLINFEYFSRSWRGASPNSAIPR